MVADIEDARTGMVGIIDQNLMAAHDSFWSHVEHSPVIWCSFGAFMCFEGDVDAYGFIARLKLCVPHAQPRAGPSIQDDVGNKAGVRTSDQRPIFSNA